MQNIFSSRADYREYVQACEADLEKASSFRNWFETYYYYEMTDAMPALVIGVVNFETYRAAMLN